MESSNTPLINLRELTDNQLVARVQQQNCSESIEELSRRHIGLVTQIVTKYSKPEMCSGLSVPELIENKLSIVYSAAQAFDPSKQVKFVTWLGNKARFFCLHALKRESKYVTVEPEVSQFYFDNAAEKDDAKLLEECDYVFSILEKLSDKRIKKIITMRYFSEDKSKRSFNAIGRELGMSSQGVHDLHDNFIRFISAKIQAKNNMDKI